MINNLNFLKISEKFGWTLKILSMLHVLGQSRQYILFNNYVQLYKIL